MQGIGRPNQFKPSSVPLPPNRREAYGAMPAPPAPKKVVRKNSRKNTRKNNRRTASRNNRKNSRKNNRKSRNNRKH